MKMREGKVPEMKNLQTIFFATLRYNKNKNSRSREGGRFLSTYLSDVYLS